MNESDTARGEQCERRTDIKASQLTLDLCFTSFAFQMQAADALVLLQLPVDLHWLQNSIALATENDLDVLNSLDLFLDKGKHRINSNDGIICTWGLSVRDFQRPVEMLKQNRTTEPRSMDVETPQTTHSCVLSFQLSSHPQILFHLLSILFSVLFAHFYF